MAVKLHRAGYEHAQSMIQKGVELATIPNNWNEVKPDADDKLNYLKGHSLDEYGKWFLGLDTEKPAHDSSKFMYPYGDFDVVQQSGLTAIEQEAGKMNHPEIKMAAQELLKKVGQRKK